MLTHKTTEGKATNQQAAEASRHLNALAFLHDTKKALHAYHQVVSLAPENAEGWTQLGPLRYALDNSNRQLMPATRRSHVGKGQATAVLWQMPTAPWASDTRVGTISTKQKPCTTRC